MRAMAGLHRPRPGEVVFGGRQVARLPAHRIAALGMALVPKRQVFPELTVDENLELGAHRVAADRRQARRAACAVSQAGRTRIASGRVAVGR
jgi:ABC-type branched-subunit amino acid transport system ATPase component